MALMQNISKTAAPISNISFMAVPLLGIDAQRTRPDHSSQTAPVELRKAARSLHKSMYRRHDAVRTGFRSGPERRMIHDKTVRGCRLARSVAFSKVSAAKVARRRTGA